MSDICTRFAVTWPGFTLDVDLTLPNQGVSVLFGPSGSGKTTLLRCIAGLIRPPRGYLSVNGQIWQDEKTFRPTYQRPIGYVFQEASLFPHLNVEGNLNFGLRRLRNPSPQKLAQAIELMGIGHLLGRKPHGLSGGERQRISLAQALSLSPELLLMDEPLSALDQPRKLEILPFLERLKQEAKIPIIYVSHAADEVARLADYLVVMHEGKAITQGALSDVLTDLNLPIRLGEDTGAILHACVGAIDQQWHLARMDFAGGSLWTKDPNLALNTKVRVRVLARDVSLAREQPSLTSIQNLLQGIVVAVSDDSHPSQLLIRVLIGHSALVARMTKRSAAALQIACGQPVWVQVKSVALL